MSSTFLSRRSLQAGLDPENDDFPGIETNDDIYLTEFVIIAETEGQPNGVQFFFLAIDALEKPAKNTREQIIYLNINAEFVYLQMS